MSLYVISDLHLSTGEGCNKSMEVFGRRWTGYIDKLRRNWCALIQPEDSVVIPGDISWALTLSAAAGDLGFLDSLPGKKYLGKGNHDFWWSTATKMTNFLAEQKYGTLSFLYNNAAQTEDFILCGTRGWYQEAETAEALSGADYQKMVAREAIRLRLSLTEAVKLRGESQKEILVFLHFPPVWNGKTSDTMLEVLAEYGIRRCYFGHIHGAYTVKPVTMYNGTDFMLVSADYLDFVPRIILPY